MVELLRVRGLTKRFGGLLAINHLDFDVQEGEILGIVGPNGAGKSTILNLLCGFLQPSVGEIMLQGQKVTGLRPEQIAALGMTKTFQANDVILSEMTVLQQIIMGCHLEGRAGFWQALFGLRSYHKEEKAILQRAVMISERLGLSTRENVITGGLPVGYKRVLGLATAIATRPKVLLLDEPVSGTNFSETQALMDIIRTIRDREGVTVLLIEHHMRVINELCDRVIVLDCGMKISEGTPEEVVKDQRVIEAYLGVED
jgi:branched-chain amino acid transport system ATP-binding protein